MKRVDLICIYIPLCFYFIREPCWSRLRGSSYLHSIMLLLYLSGALQCPQAFLHLHSIMLLLYPYTTSFSSPFAPNLHSIMLLLYQSTAKKKQQQMLESTFHYASTLSVEDKIQAGTIDISTFHYASTLSRPPGRWLLQCPYLHSIMLLLYPRCDWLCCEQIQIYIPLCFYFITRAGRPEPDKLYLHSIMLLLYRISSFKRLVSAQSTFHYASTLSRLLNQYTCCKVHLHSIMLLLYPFSRHPE